MRGAVYGDLFISVHHGKSGELHVPKGMCAQRDACAHTRTHTRDQWYNLEVDARALQIVTGISALPHT